jgi:glycerate kinase
MARVAGRALLPHPRGDQVLRAGTAGVGELLLAVRDQGAGRIIVGLGGSATTDGGLGAYRAVGSPHALAGVDVVAACDVVTVPFMEAAHRFSAQKGATDAQIDELTRRLVEVAAQYRQETGVDVTAVEGAGAAGGLAGGLLALGARLAGGFGLVARLVQLRERIAGADLVVTGEGRVDGPSFQGKVPGGVLGLAEGRSPVLCIAGDADPALLVEPPAGLELVSLTARVGTERARRDTVALVGQVTAEVLRRRRP